MILHTVVVGRNVCIMQNSMQTDNKMNAIQAVAVMLSISNMHTHD